MTKTYILLAIASFTFLIGCTNKTNQEYTTTNYYKISGPAQGTSYHITLETNKPDVLQAKIDSLIEVIDVSMSTYRGDSYITKWNENSLTLEDSSDQHFNEVLKASKKVFAQTDGYFDPTVGPLLEYYGFGKNLDKSIDEKQLPKLKAVMGLEKISLSNELHPTKTIDGISLNFNAIAQGYTVDVLGELLASEGVTNFMIELGGEVKVAGLNKDAGAWSIGIERPLENIELEQDLKKRLQTIVKLEGGMSLATSGNYRNFKVDKATGEKYGHIVDPISLKPVKSKLLSATIVTANCAEADGVATALMAMGLDKARAFLLEYDDSYDAFLIYIDDEKGLSVWNSEDLQLEAITQ